MARGLESLGHIDTRDWGSIDSGGSTDDWGSIDDWGPINFWGVG